jgi:flagellar biosynthetic protein FliQ
MTPETVVEIAQQAMRTVIFVAGPMLVAGMLVGLAISIFQAATQVNEMTMTFVPKILTVFVVLVLSLPWAITQLTNFTTAMFARIAAM